MEASIIARITSETSSFKKIGVVADITALMHDGNAKTKLSLQNLPGVFLFYAGESAQSAKDRPGKWSQRSTQRWGAMIVTRSRNDASGQRAKAEAYALNKELSLALCGWTPDNAITALQKSRNAGSLKRWAKDLYFYAAYFEADERICTTGD